MIKKFGRESTINSIEKFVQMYNTIIELVEVRDGVTAYDEAELSKVASDFKVRPTTLKIYFRGFRTAYGINDIRYFSVSSFKELTGLEESEFMLSAVGASSSSYGKKIRKPAKAVKVDVVNEDEEIIKEFKDKFTALGKDISGDIVDEFLSSFCKNDNERASYIVDNSFDDIVEKIDKYYMDSLFSLLDTSDTPENVEKFNKLDIVRDDKSVALFKAKMLEKFPQYTPELIEGFIKDETNTATSFRDEDLDVLEAALTRYYNSGLKELADEVLKDPHELTVEDKKDNVDSFDCAVDMVRSAISRMENVLSSVYTLNDIKSLEELEHVITTYKKALKIKSDFEELTANFDK